MSAPVAGRADFQAYASWMGTPIVIPSTTYNPGTTVIEDLSLSNYSALNILAFDVAGNGNIQFQFFTDSTKTQSVDVFRYVLVNGAALNLTVPMISPFVEISAVVEAAQTLTMISLFTPNNEPVLRPTYPGQVRSLNGYLDSIAASATIFSSQQYIIGGEGYAYFRPSDSSGKLDFIINVLGDTGAVNYELLSFRGATTPQNTRIICPPQPIQIQITNNDGAAAHVASWSLQQIGN